MNFSDLLFQVSSSVEGCINFCKERGLLRKTFVCVNCEDSLCKWRLRMSSIDSYAWRCPKCKKYFSIRSGSFFERSKLEIQQILKILYLWSYEKASFSNIQRECRISSEHTVTGWKNFIRDICCQHFLNNPQIIGGPGHTVEIDETVFNARKYNVGKATVPIWIFGGYDPEDKEGFLITVPNRKPETLLPLVKKYILPGTTIISNLGKEGFQNLAVYNFVDPDTGATTNHVKRFWKEAKRKNKNDCGTSRHQVSAYLQEFMWRQKFGKPDPFATIISQISDLFQEKQLLSHALLSFPNNIPNIITTTTTTTTTTNNNNNDFSTCSSSSNIPSSTSDNIQVSISSDSPLKVKIEKKPAITTENTIKTEET